MWDICWSRGKGRRNVLEVRRLILIDCAIARVVEEKPSKHSIRQIFNSERKQQKRGIQDADSLGLLTDLDSGDDMVRLLSTISGITCEYPFVSMARRTKICAF
jgi:hypothetical protein